MHRMISGQTLNATGAVCHLYDMFPVRLSNVQTFQRRVIADQTSGSHSTCPPYKITKEPHKCHFPHMDRTITVIAEGGS